MRVVSFSLFGTSPVYREGAIKNARLVQQYYPGFHSYFYVGKSVHPETIDTLMSIPNTNVLVVDGPEDYTATFWRFRASSDPDTEVMLSRDCDYRICEREAEAVYQWLDSPYEFHIMRDHPWHDVPILAGLFGARGQALRMVGKWSEIWYRFASNNYQTDQAFLQSAIYPVVKHNSMIHDEYFHYEDELANHAIPFPSPRVGGEFIGEGYDENDNLLNPEHQYGRRV